MINQSMINQSINQFTNQSNNHQSINNSISGLLLLLLLHIIMMVQSVWGDFAGCLSMSEVLKSYEYV